MHTTDTKKRSAKNLFFSGVIVLTVANILVKSVGLISKIALKILKTTYPFKILGKENMPEGGAVVVCNHLK